MGRDNFVSAQPVDVLGDVLGGPKAQSIQTQLRYDYSLIAAEQRNTVIDAAIDIVSNSRKAKDSLIAIGQRLTHVKSLLDHGQFSDWCATEFDMSQRTAQNMMNVARTFGGKNETVSLLSDSALYLLAAPSVTDTAREAVIEQAKANGVSPSKTEVKRIIDSHKPAPEPAKPGFSANHPIHRIAGGVFNTAPAVTEPVEVTTNSDTKPVYMDVPAPVVTLDELEVVASVTVPWQAPVEESHPLDCYDDTDANPYVGKMGKLHELKMWLKETQGAKLKEYRKLTEREVPAGFTSAIDQMIAVLEATMNAVEQEAVANANQ